MTRIDFYSNAEPKLQIACQLSARAVQQSLRVLILAPEESTVRAIDRLLWTFPATGDRKSTRLNSSHSDRSRMPSSA